MSARVSTSSALNVACSGAMYSGVPATRAEGGEQALLGQLQPAGGLGQAEVDHLGDRLAVVALDQDVRRLQVAVDDPLLVRVLHRRADLAEQRQPVRQAEAVLVAVLGERDALDQLHDEERPAVVGRAGVEDPGDVGVVHQGQGLPLRLEPGQDGPRVHARLDQLERHLPLDRLRLLGEVDGAHAPFADLLAELVPAGDDAADERIRWGARQPEACCLTRNGRRSFPGHRRRLVRGRRLPGVFREGSLQGAGGLIVGGQQFFEALRATPDRRGIPVPGRRARSAGSGRSRAALNRAFTRRGSRAMARASGVGFSRLAQTGAAESQEIWKKLVHPGGSALSTGLNRIKRRVMERETALWGGTVAECLSGPWLSQTRNRRATLGVPIGTASENVNLAAHVEEEKPTSASALHVVRGRGKPHASGFWGATMPSSINSDWSASGQARAVEWSGATGCIDCQNTSDQRNMKINIGFDILYDCPQPTPMILTLSVHYSRISDLLRPD